MESFVNTIGNLGFPIVVSVYLLVRIEDKLNSLSESIQGLTSVINKLNN